MAWSTRQLGDLAVTTVKAIRHSHEIGLLEVPERTANGYKQYQAAHLLRLLQIKRLRDLGVPLSQIAALAVILRHRAPMHVPPAFAPVSHDFSDTNQSLLMIYSAVFGEEGMEDFRRVVAERGETDDEFDALPPDADDAAIERLAERMAPRGPPGAGRAPLVERPGERTPAIRQNDEATRSTITDTTPQHAVHCYHGNSRTYSDGPPAREERAQGTQGTGRVPRHLAR
jgi:DNA-binding transcriptional MerR regulator